jgi:DNA-binding CsgD family transcriptional regulator
MAHRPARNKHLESLAPLPFGTAHWRAIAEEMELSPQQAKIVEWILRGACRKQIAAVMGISEPTIKSYLDRVFARTGTRDCMQLAMHVLAVSHRLLGDAMCHPKR